MSLNISGFSSLSQIPAGLAAPAADEGGSSFKDVLSSAIDQVEGSSHDAANRVDQFLSGNKHLLRLLSFMPRMFLTQDPLTCDFNNGITS